MACDVPGISHVQVLHSGLRGPVQGLPSQFRTRPAAICRSKPSIQNRRAPGSQHSSSDRCPFGVIPCCRRRCPLSGPMRSLIAKRGDTSWLLRPWRSLLDRKYWQRSSWLAVVEGPCRLRLGCLPTNSCRPRWGDTAALHPLLLSSRRGQPGLVGVETSGGACPAGVEPHRQPRQAQAQGRKTSCQR